MIFLCSNFLNSNDIKILFKMTLKCVFYFSLHDCSYHTTVRRERDPFQIDAQACILHFAVRRAFYIQTRKRVIKAY